MIPRWVGAISYSIGSFENFPEHRFPLSFASCIAQDLGVTPLRSERWMCRLPDPTKLVPRSPGYSETRGILGGIADPILAAQSEVIERVIGDALTIALVQLLELQPAVIFVKGPCFPKTLGRFLSLRLPVSSTIVWIARLRPGANTSNQMAMIPSSARKVAWDQDELLNGFTHPDGDPRWLAEFLDIGDRTAKTRIIKESLDRFGEKDGPREMRFSEAIFLPDEQPNFVKQTRVDVPQWLVAQPPVLVKRVPLAAKGPVIFEWADDA
jgi:hypothetical protein